MPELPDDVCRPEWQEDLFEWGEAPRRLLAERTDADWEKAQKSTLGFRIDVDVYSPKLTIDVGKSGRAHINMGHVKCISSDVMTARNFRVDAELSETSVECICAEVLEGDVKETAYTVLAPISLFVDLAGNEREKEPGQRSARLSTVTLTGPVAIQPLDVSLNVVLGALRVAVHPQAVRFAMRLPDAFKDVLGSDEAPAPEVPVLPPQTRRGSRRLSTAMHSARRFSTDTESRFRRLSSYASQDDEAELVTGSTGYEFGGKKLAANASAKVEIISLALFGLDGAEVARADVVQLDSSVVLSQAGQITAEAGLGRFVIEVAKTPLVQLRDNSTNTQGNKALFARVVMPTAPPLEVSLFASPLIIDWRRESIVTFVATAAACAPTGAAAQGSQATDGGKVDGEATLQEFKQALEERLTTKEKEKEKGDVTPERKGTSSTHVTCVSKFADSGDRELATSGLSADGKLPSLRSETQSLAPATIVTAKFGGLAIALHRDTAEQETLSPAWLGKPGTPLFEFHLVDLTANFKMFENGEMMGRCSLDTCSWLHCGQVIMAPCENTVSIWECDVRTYCAPEEGGPIHTVCFSCTLRQVSWFIITPFRKVHQLGHIWPPGNNSFMSVLVRFHMFLVRGLDHPNVRGLDRPMSTNNQPPIHTSNQ